MPRRVSVVVPTYRSDAGLDRLVASLDAQSMPADEFEVIFVDDGSPDDTFARLERIRDARPNVRIDRIDNSGWPSRPRNVGLELAQGEYVLFMDHDDELYPDALRAGYAMAARNGADVLNGKETRTDQPSWALDTYPENIDNAIDRTDVHPLIPTNPHKLFRRELLMRHDIRFPEGGRVLWEDVFFCLDVARHATVVSVLADTPFYHWVRGSTTTSSSFRSDRAEYWHWVREIVKQTDDKLAAPHLEQQHRLMLLHQYRSRILTRLGGELTKAPADEQQMVHDTVAELLDHIPESLDRYLTPTQLGRAVLARAGRWDLMPRLAAVDAGLVGIGRTTGVRWVDGTLHIDAEARWAVPDGSPTALRRDGGRIVRDLPADVAAALPDAALDMTGALAEARATIGIRGRASRVTRALACRTTSRIEDVDGRPNLVLAVSGTLDPTSAIYGQPLGEPVYDVFLRTQLLGGNNMRGLRTNTAPSSALRGGHIFIAYRNDNDALSVDVDQSKRSLARSARLDPDKARFVRAGDAPARWRLGRRPDNWAMSVPFTAVSTSDDSTIAGRVVLGSDKAGPAAPVPATIAARPDGAWLETTVGGRPGTYRLTLVFHGREHDSGLDVVISGGAPPRLRRRA